MLYEAATCHLVREYTEIILFYTNLAFFLLVIEMVAFLSYANLGESQSIDW